VKIPVHVATRRGFLINLIRVGMVLGFWAAVLSYALAGLAVACALGVWLSVVFAVLVVWDVRKARKEADR
jgi:hypothetical protein